MVETKSYLQIGLMISTLYATLTVIYLLRYSVIHMCWLTEVYCVIVVSKQIIIFFWDHWLHVKM